MAKHERPPEGFAIAELPDGHYYPLEAYHIYSAAFPEGFLAVHTCDEADGQPMTFTRYRAALDYCQKQALKRRAAQHERWQHLLAKSDCYPERCAWYHDLIEEITGLPPWVDRGYSRVSVMTLSYLCDARRCYHPHVCISAPTIEEALAEAAEAVYESMIRCRCASTSVASSSDLEGERHAS